MVRDLTEINADFDSILWEWVVDDRNQTEIADRYGITQPEVSEIISERRNKYKKLAAGFSNHDSWEEAFVSKMEEENHTKVVIQNAEDFLDNLE